MANEPRMKMSLVGEMPNNPVRGTVYMSPDVSGNFIKVGVGNGQHRTIYDGNANSFVPLIEITYSELKNLRDTSALVPGMQYRITDYECTAKQDDTSSAMHQFDIIVTADSSSVLNESARAIQHTDSSADYFANSNLAAWELKYCLDNDPDRFAWADYIAGIKVTRTDALYVRSESDDASIDNSTMFAWKHNNEIVYTEKAAIYYEDHAYSQEYNDNYAYMRGTIDAVKPYRMICEYQTGGSGSGSGSGSDDIITYTEEFFRDPNYDSYDMDAWCNSAYTVTLYRYTYDMTSIGNAVYDQDGNVIGTVTDILENGIVYNNTFYIKYDSYNFYNYYMQSWSVIDNLNNRIGTMSETPSAGDDVYPYYYEVRNVIKVKNEESNSKGVVFYMKDEFGNECGYDFKNILMKFYKITAVTTVPSDLNNTYSVSKVIGGNGYTIASGCTVSSSDTEYRYTFDLFSNNTHSDYSLNTASSNKAKFCYDNVITPMYGYTYTADDENNKKMWINFISFRNTGNGCYGNKFGALNYNMSFGDYCYSNTFGNGCRSNTFGNSCFSNTFGNSCYSNTFGGYCEYNTFGSICCVNTFVRTCVYNTFGYSYTSNTLGDDCTYNTFGNYCSHNTFGDKCSYNTFGNYCYFIKFGNSSSAKSYYQYIIVENGNRYIYLDTTQTTSSSNKIQNVKIAQGVNNNTIAIYKTISHNTVNDAFQTVYQPANSKTISI